MCKIAFPCLVNKRSVKCDVPMKNNLFYMTPVVYELKFYMSVRLRLN